MSIPLYTFDFALIDFIGRRHALRLERDGMAKVVRHKKGTINRVVLHRRACDPRRPTTVRDYQGQAYSFEQALDDGHECWKLRPLQGGISDSKTLSRTASGHVSYSQAPTREPINSGNERIDGVPWPSRSIHSTSL